MEVLVWIFLDLLWWGLCYQVGRLILLVVSFGRVQAGSCGSYGYGWLGYKRDVVGRLEIESTLVAGIGLVTCCVALVAILLFIP